MNEANIKCPNCGYEIPMTEALQRQIRGEVESALKAEHNDRLQRAVAEAERRARNHLDVELADLKNQLTENADKAKAAEARELELRRKNRALEQAGKVQAEQIRAELEKTLRKEQAEHIAKATTAAEHRAREQSERQLTALQADLEAQREKARRAQTAELALRKEKSALEERARSLDLEVARKLDEEKRKLEDSLRKSLSEAQDLKLKEKEKQIRDLRDALEDAKRRSELGSQELQGEVLELDIQAALERQFPADQIEPVPKGVRGADIVQRVRNERLEDCGTIVWETKNTKAWSDAWTDKLKQDQRAIGGATAAIVSVALPKEIESFGRLDGVWVANPRVWPALAVALREQLIQVAQARAALTGKREKMELLYEYLAGDEFRQRVEAIVDGFEALQMQIHRERRAMEKQWTEREKQLQRVLISTAGMYGALQGIVGSGLGAIPALELDESHLLEDCSNP